MGDFFVEINKKMVSSFDFSLKVRDFDFLSQRLNRKPQGV